MGIKLEGFDELRNDLNRMAEKAGSAAADKALRAGAKPIYRDMKRQAKIDPKIRTGNLYKSIKVGRITLTTRRSNYKTAKRIRIGSFEKAEAGAYAPHAHLVEYGHGGPYPAPPHPFVRPAFDRKQDEALEEIRRVLKEELK